MSDVQTVQPDTRQHGPLDTTNGNGEMDNEEKATRRTRRKLRPTEVVVIKRFQNLAEVGNSIAYTDLPDELKRIALNIAKDIRLVDKGILVCDYSLADGRIESVSLDPEMMEVLQDELQREEPKPKVVARQRNRNNILSDSKYHLRKLKDSNPRREGTHAWYNWEYCYHDDMSVPDYMDYMDYPRDIRIRSTSPRSLGKESWFNGPSSTYLMQDIESGAIGVWDTTLTDIEYLTLQEVITIRESNDGNGNDFPE